MYNRPGGWRFILPAALSRGRLEFRTDDEGTSHIGGTLGQRLVNTNRSQLSLSAGLSVNDEQGVDTSFSP